MLLGLKPEAFFYIFSGISFLNKGFSYTKAKLRAIGMLGGIMLKKYWVIPIIAAVLLTVCNWIALAGDVGGEAIQYFPLKAKNIWSYKVTLPNNETYSQILVVNSQVGQDIRVMVLLNRMPWMEVIYSINEEGLFRTKQISAQGVEVIEP